MNNIMLLENEYNEYLHLKKEIESLEKKLNALHINNEENNKELISEITKRLRELKSNLLQYNEELLKEFENYLNLRQRFNDISGEITIIEEKSKSSIDSESVTLSSSEGIRKKIDKNYVLSYIKLIEDKQRLKTELNKMIQKIEKITTMRKMDEKDNDRDVKIYPNPNIEATSPKFEASHINDTEEEMNYQIVNRKPSFKENTCLKVNENRKIASVPNDVLTNIRIPFDRLRERQELDYVTRKEVMETVAKLMEEDKQNKTKKRVLTNEGFLETASFIFTTSLLITITIFVVVGFIVFR